jgi:hypothetical protein
MDIFSLVMKNCRYCHVIERLQTESGLVIGFNEHLQNVPTNNYDSLTELHAPNITVTTAHTKSSVSIIRCLVAAFNGGRSQSSGFRNCTRPQPAVSHFSQLQLSTDSNNSR